MKKYKLFDVVYFVQSPRTIQSATIVGFAGGRYTLYLSAGSGLRLPESRLYPSYEAAEAAIPPPIPSPENQVQTKKESLPRSGAQGRYHWSGGGIDRYLFENK